MGTSLHHSPTVADVDISDELNRRQVAAPDYLSEKLAIQDLAHRMANRPAQVLPRLTDLALELCNAESCGVSVLEGDEFRWQGVSGRLAALEGTTTPAHCSPCSICLDRRTPVLLQHPERIYPWIADTNVEVPEILLVPLMSSQGPLGTVWIVAKDGQALNAGHARVMSELAVFTCTTLQMIQADEAMKAALKKHETFAREMSHRVKNFFAVTDSLVRMTARHTTSKEEMVDNLLRRLVALSDAHSLAQDQLAEDHREAVAIDVILGTVLRPYRKYKMTGPPVQLTPFATSSFTLLLHELATNAAKYGALSSPDGSLEVAWQLDADQFVMDWIEKNGSLPCTAPTQTGLGTTLIRNVARGLAGTIDTAWNPDGLHVRIVLPPACIGD